SNRGVALCEIGRTNEALANYDRAITIDPHHAVTLTNRGYCNLLIGRLREGWADHEWRFEASASLRSRRPGFANWNGESLEGRHLLVFSEQGFGDTIQFARYLPLLSTRRCRITFLTYPELVSLLRSVTSGIEVITTLPRERNFDFQ